MSKGQRSTRDADASRRESLSHHEIEKLMMPGNYQPRRHRKRAMPKRKERLSASMGEAFANSKWAKGIQQ